MSIYIAHRRRKTSNALKRFSQTNECKHVVSVTTNRKSYMGFSWNLFLDHYDDLDSEKNLESHRQVL